MKKTLYLSGDAAGKIHLDGPSLVYQSGVRSAQRFPLPRISRIVAAPGAALNWDALLACARHRVSVFVQNRCGDLQAVWAPCPPRHTSLGALVDDWLDSGHWRRTWQDWCSGKESFEIARAARAARRALYDRRPASARTQLKQALGLTEHPRRDALFCILRGMLYSHVGQRLLAAGIDPVKTLGGVPGFEPARAFTSILEWAHLAPAAACHGADSLGDVSLWQAAVRVYESVAGREDKRITALLDSLAVRIGGARWGSTD